MATSLPDARQLSDEVLEALRLRALRGCELGYSETELAELLGVARETVCHWWSAYPAGRDERRGKQGKTAITVSEAAFIGRDRCRLVRGCCPIGFERAAFPDESAALDPASACWLTQA